VNSKKYIGLDVHQANSRMDSMIKVAQTAHRFRALGLDDIEQRL
jgi:hypothetical protein